MRKLFHQHIEREKWRKVSFFSSILVASYREHCEWRHKFFFLNNPSTLVCVHTHLFDNAQLQFSLEKCSSRVFCVIISNFLCVVSLSIRWHCRFFAKIIYRFSEYFPFSFHHSNGISSHRQRQRRSCSSSFDQSYQVICRRHFCMNLA